jgi:hypothetical protein
VLELVVKAPEEPQRASRRAARTGFLALQAPEPPRKRRSSGLLRVTALAVALGFAGAWWIQQLRAAAEAHTLHIISSDATRA